jgi:hypothetical protein
MIQRKSPLKSGNWVRLLLAKEGMMNGNKWEPALAPEDLARFFVQRANEGELDGLVTLYEKGALLAIGPGDRVAVGREAIRDFYAELLATRPKVEPGDQRPALRLGNMALTSSRLVNGTITAEVARTQVNGTWLWVIDQPAIARQNAD